MLVEAGRKLGKSSAMEFREGEWFKIREESNAIRGVRTKKIIGVSNFLKRQIVFK